MHDEHTLNANKATVARFNKDVIFLASRTLHTFNKILRPALPDLVRVKDGRYVEHWGVNTVPAVLAQLRSAS